MLESAFGKCCYLTECGAVEKCIFFESAVEEIAETITFLISENASYLNGSNIPVNGGLF